MYEFWYDYVKPKYGHRAKLFYMETESFIIHIITEDFYEDIFDDVERWFDTSNYDENKTGKRLLPIGMNKKTIKEFCALKPKTYAYLMDDDSEKKKNKKVRNKT